MTIFIRVVMDILRILKISLDSYFYRFSKGEKMEEVFNGLSAVLYQSMYCFYVHEKAIIKKKLPFCVSIMGHVSMFINKLDFVVRTPVLNS